MQLILVDQPKVPILLVVVLCTTTVEVDLGGLDHAQREYFPPVSISELRYSPIVPLKLCSRLELLGAPPPSQ